MLIRSLIAIAAVFGAVMTGCGQKSPKAGAAADSDVQPIEQYIKGKGYEKYSTATFAGGCFWCIEASFERIRGVKDVISGYSGGDEKYPTYEQVGSSATGHAESVQIYFDPKEVSFDTLLAVFFVAHDPTQVNRQGPDVGPQYRSAIFYHDVAQKSKAEAFFKQQAGHFDRPIATQLAPYKEFWVAEGYHQDYYDHHPENPYIQRISKPKVAKVEKRFKAILKK